jgi:hypothetical protein
MRAISHLVVNESGDQIRRIRDRSNRKALLNEPRLQDRSCRENIALKEQIDQTSMFWEIVGWPEPLRPLTCKRPSETQSPPVTPIMLKCRSVHPQFGTERPNGAGTAVHNRVQPEK